MYTPRVRYPTENAAPGPAGETHEKCSPPREPEAIFDITYLLHRIFAMRLNSVINYILHSLISTDLICNPGCRMVVCWACAPELCLSGHISLRFVWPRTVFRCTRRAASQPLAGSENHPFSLSEISGIQGTAPVHDCFILTFAASENDSLKF